MGEVACGEAAGDLITARPVKVVVASKRTVVVEGLHLAVEVEIWRQEAGACHKLLRTPSVETYEVQFSSLLTINDCHYAFLPSDI